MWPGAEVVDKNQTREHRGKEMAASAKGINCVCVFEYNVFKLKFPSQKPCSMTSH